MKYLILGLLFCVSSVLSAQEEGIAQVYSDAFQGSKTAYEELYDKDKPTAAHKDYPHNTIIRVTRLDNGKSVIVRVNDRGPFYRERVVELSRAAGEKIDLIPGQTTMVRVEEVSKPKEFDKKIQPSKSTAKGGGMTKIDLNNVKESAYGLFEVTSKRVAKSGYAVQIGVFSDYKNVLKQIATLNENKVFNLSVLMEKNSKGEDIYKILAGPYGKLAEASSRKSELRKKGFSQCFVVNLSEKEKK